MERAFVILGRRAEDPDVCEGGYIALLVSTTNIEPTGSSARRPRMTEGEGAN
jgi:hypothetical protein